MDNCFLVVDLVNRTAEEMQLTYAGRKQLQIEAGDTCRLLHKRLDHRINKKRNKCSEAS